MTAEHFCTLLRDYAENTGLALDDMDDTVLVELNELGVKLVWKTEQILHERMTGAKMDAFTDAFGE